MDNRQLGTNHAFGSSNPTSFGLFTSLRFFLSLPSLTTWSTSCFSDDIGSLYTSKLEYFWPGRASAQISWSYDLRYIMLKSFAPEIPMGRSESVIYFRCQSRPQNVNMPPEYVRIIRGPRSCAVHRTLAQYEFLYVHTFISINFFFFFDIVSLDFRVPLHWTRRWNPHGALSSHTWNVQYSSFTNFAICSRPKSYRTWADASTGNNGKN